MPVRLPLFPLSTVLVPGLVLPLHVFEPRYRTLIQALVELPDGAPRHFGVIATRTGREVGSARAEDLYPVGCTAELREVTPYSDGRYDIVTVGHVRFRLQDFDPDAETPYHTGLVDFLDERDGDLDEPGLAELAERVALRFAAYRDRLNVEQGSVPGDPRVLSYLVAAAAVLEIPVRQGLLEQETTVDRLRAELDVLRSEIAMIDAFRTLPATDLLREAVNPN